MKRTICFMAVALSLGAFADEAAWVDISEAVARKPTGTVSESVASATSVTTAVATSASVWLESFSSYVVLRGFALLFR